MPMKLGFLAFFCLLSFCPVESVAQEGYVEVELISTSQAEETVKTIPIWRKKLILAALVLTLGPLGVHRLYLGTHPGVPVFYTLTLGGGFGILPIIDLIAILTSKDLSRFENNGKILMFSS